MTFASPSAAHPPDQTPEATAGEPGAAPITMFSTPWCGYCHRLTAQLGRAGIAIRVVNIEDDPDSAALVRQLNRGNETVPTLLFADGSALTNPSIREVEAKLAAGLVQPERDSAG